MSPEVRPPWVLIAAAVGLLVPWVWFGILSAWLLRSDASVAVFALVDRIEAATWPLCIAWSFVGPAQENDLVRGALYLVPFSAINSIVYASPALVYRGLAERRLPLTILGAPLTLFWAVWLLVVR
jgi:hypothetical protein